MLTVYRADEYEHDYKILDAVDGILVALLWEIESCALSNCYGLIFCSRKSVAWYSWMYRSLSTIQIFLESNHQIL